MPKGTFVPPVESVQLQLARPFTMCRPNLSFARTLTTMSDPEHNPIPACKRFFVSKINRCAGPLIAPPVPVPKCAFGFRESNRAETTPIHGGTSALSPESARPESLQKLFANISGQSDFRVRTCDLCNRVAYACV